MFGIVAFVNSVLLVTVIAFVTGGGGMPSIPEKPGM